MFSSVDMTAGGKVLTDRSASDQQFDQNGEVLTNFIDSWTSNTNTLTVTVIL